MKLVLMISLILAVAFSSFGQPTAAGVSHPTFDDAAAIRQKTFEKVWSTVNEKHYDPSFGGVDWKRVKEIYEPKAAAAVSDADFHNVLRQMLAELKLSHFGIHPPAAEMVAAQTGRGVTGIDVIMLDGVPVINRVDPGSSAERSGIRPGFIVDKIDGQQWQDVVAKIEASLAARKVTEAMRKVYLERTLEAAINGKPGGPAAIEVLDDGNKRLAFKVDRVPFNGEMSQAMGNFPPQEVIFESRRLPGDVGYIRFNMWVIPQMAKIRAALSELSGINGMVIDLRGNPGGVGGMAPGFAGHLFSKRVSLGTMRSRGGSMEFVVFPQKDPFTGPVVILIDHGTGSTSEVFAAGMQETGRATIIGSTSAGAVLPSVFEKLPTGFLFQYAVSDYRSPKKILIEGRGVFPDREVRKTRRDLLAGKDLQLEEALTFIANAAKGTGKSAAAGR
ncbi:MAG: hypothetical protein IPM25_12375 [Chloracidobacterium sp.]|nr:hypothetical protein [Chloracidobacterium sp.]